MTNLTKTIVKIERKTMKIYDFTSKQTNCLLLEIHQSKESFVLQIYTKYI